MTVKPVQLIKHLIELFLVKGQTVLAPFLGTGTTAVAARETGRAAVGIEKEPEYVEICRKRITAEAL